MKNGFSEDLDDTNDRNEGTVPENDIPGADENNNMFKDDTNPDTEGP
ncbi:hypothetical protein SC499_23100 [Peribacillus simplex]|nr:hypothetical protein [Peribacillus simplex]MDW7617487.1 hypothetical protein [Peribacillus simplex]